MQLNYKRTFFIGLAFMSICAFWQLYDNVIPLILSETFGIGEIRTGAIMGIDNILALFLLPFIGTLSDKVHTKLGKRTPFIIVGTFIAVTFMILIPYADTKKNFLLFFLSLGFVLIAMACYRSPAVALMPDLTPKPLRSKANAVINLMGTLGGIFTLIMIKSLIPNNIIKPNYMPVYIAVAALMVLAVVILLVAVPENKLAKEVAAENNEDITTKEDLKSHVLPKDVKRSLIFLLLSVFLWFTAYNAVTSAFSRYAIKVWGFTGGSYANALLVATGAATISYIPIGFLSSKFGRKKTIIGGIILMTLSYMSGFLVTDYSMVIYVIFAFTGIGWAAISVNSYPMVVEMSHGGDVGKYTGIYYTFSMLAQTITPIVSGALLEKVSYRTLFPYAFVFSILSLCTMLFVKHGNSKPELKNALENFDLDD